MAGQCAGLRPLEARSLHGWVANVAPKRSSARWSAMQEFLARDITRKVMFSDLKLAVRAEYIRAVDCRMRLSAPFA
tara:strand:+ start:5968 stop:6195 length:228 start_codon:yes stop_codon:yes gene_type:complete